MSEPGFLGPLSVEAFMQDHFGRHHLHVRDCLEAESIATVAEIEKLLAEDTFDRLDISELSGDHATPAPVASVAQARSAVADGAGLVVAGLERVLPEAHPLQRLFRQIGTKLGIPGRGMTAFLASGRASLAAHNDVYEAFTVQLAGRKRWLLYDLVSPGLAVQGRRVSESEPTVDLTLEPGDLLYVPKGQIHRVVPEGAERSLSVALAFNPDSWHALLHHVVARLEHDPRFWQSIRDLDGELGERQSLVLKAVLDFDADRVT